MNLSLRPSVETDLPLIRQLFESVREPEFLAGGIHGEQLRQLLDGQFHAQRIHYAAAYPEREDSIVVLNGDDIGNWLVAELPNELRLIDVTLAPAHRGRGIGTSLLQQFVERSHETEKPIVLHVEMQNPARRLYDRFGFIEEEDVGVYWRMRRPIS